MKAMLWAGVAAVAAVLLTPLVLAVLIAGVLSPTITTAVPCGPTTPAETASSPSATPKPAQAASNAVEGGIGFELPQPQMPLRNSVRQPALAIPAQVQRLYVGAATRYQVPWTLLAGIGMEETGHGRTRATSTAGARGLMQFMPATFTAMGVDGNGDGEAVIDDDADSIFSAANYLTRAGVSQGADGVRKALYAYNLNRTGFSGGRVVPSAAAVRG